MCYSQKTSIISYSLGMLSAIFAFFTGQYIIGMLILFFCQMQLSELLIWRGIDTDNTSLNKAGTAYGKYLLPTHNIAIGLGILITLYIKKQGKLTSKDFSALLVGIAFYLIIVLGVYPRYDDAKETYPVKACTDTNDRCQNSQNRLAWPYNHSWYFWSFLISLIISAVYYKEVGKASEIYFSLFFVITFAIALIFFNSNASGSVFCFLAAICAPVLVVGNYFIMKYN